MIIDQTIADIFIRCINQYPNNDFIIWREDNNYKKLTYRQVSVEVIKCCEALKNSNIDYGQYIIYWGPVSLQAIILDLACQVLGIIFIGISPSMSMTLVHNTIKNVKPKLFMISDHKIENIISNKSEIFSTITIVSNKSAPGIILWEKYVDQPHYKLDLEVYKEKKLTQNSSSSIFFTSGSIGLPKGVIHTNKSLLSAKQSFYKRFDMYLNIHLRDYNENVMLLMDCPFSVLHNCFLPFFMSNGVSIVIEEIRPEVFKEMNPHAFFVTGGILGNIYKLITKKIDELSFIKRKLVIYTIERLKRKIIPSLSSHHYIPPKLDLISKVLDFIFLKPIRQVFGNNISGIYTGASPQDFQAAELFFALRIPVWDTYSCTECPMIACNYAKSICLGTVGKPDENLAIDIDIETNSLLIKGDPLFYGYLGELPRDLNQWYETGDIASLDENGFLHVLGRVKNRIKLQQGYLLNAENVEIEMLKSKYIDQICVFGDGRKYLVAIIKPSSELPSNLSNTALKDFLLTKIHQLHHDLDLQYYELIKDIFIIKEGFTTQNNMLTDTKKIIRYNIYSTYESEINKMYSEING